MGTAEISASEFPSCEITKSADDVDKLDESLKSRSQLFFENVAYNQRGKYICVATQQIQSGPKTERAVGLIHFLTYIPFLTIFYILPFFKGKIRKTNGAFQFQKTPKTRKIPIFQKKTRSPY